VTRAAVRPELDTVGVIEEEVILASGFKVGILVGLTSSL